VSLVDLVLNADELRHAPPILVNIGASGRLHPKWRRIAKHPIRLAFGPDEREHAETTDSGEFEALHAFNRAVSEDAEAKTRSEQRARSCD
jgi:hypothetical protein